MLDDIYARPLGEYNMCGVVSLAAPATAASFRGGALSTKFSVCEDVAVVYCPFCWLPPVNGIFRIFDGKSKWQK